MYKSIRFVIFEYNEHLGQRNIHDIRELDIYTKGGKPKRSLADEIAFLNKEYSAERFTIEIQFCNDLMWEPDGYCAWDCTVHNGKCKYNLTKDPAADHCIYCGQPHERK